MESPTKVSGPKAYLVPIIIMIVMGLILFLPAGSFKYWQGWIWWAEISAITLFITAYFIKNDPRLLSRRMKVKEKQPQPFIIKTLSLLSMFTYLLPGFDYRFHWSAIPIEVVIASNTIVLTGYMIIFFVFKQNSYASAVIQVEEEQSIISTGLYAIVRHPMYSGLLMMMLFTPLALGSYWALLFASLFIPTIIFRIRKEEELLLRQLPGYTDYCQKTRYRLIPQIW